MNSGNTKQQLLAAIEQAPDAVLPEALHYLQYLTERYLEAYWSHGYNPGIPGFLNGRGLPPVERFGRSPTFWRSLTYSY
jgi:hypothetical protein